MEISKEQLTAIAEGMNLIALSGGDIGDAINEMAVRLNEDGVWAEYEALFETYLNSSAKQIAGLKVVMEILQELKWDDLVEDTPETVH